MPETVEFYKILENLIASEFNKILENSIGRLTKRFSDGRLKNSIASGGIIDEPSADCKMKKTWKKTRTDSYTCQM